jgi:hypothetical protein
LYGNGKKEHEIIIIYSNSMYVLVHTYSI